MSLDDLDALILKGAIEPAGIDPNTGEMLYNFTDKLKNVHPALHKEVSNMFNSHVMILWEKGMVDMNPTLENPTVSLTPRAFSRKLISSLDEDVAHTLKEIKRVTRTK